MSGRPYQRVMPASEGTDKFRKGIKGRRHHVDASLGEPVSNFRGLIANDEVVLVKYEPVAGQLRFGIVLGHFRVA